VLLFYRRKLGTYSKRPGQEIAMIAQGKYEVLLQAALQRLRPGPWNEHDLARVKDTLNEDFCLAFGPECDKAAVLDWLNSLPPEEISDLLIHLNMPGPGQ
jgi:hypothetical protein